MDVVRGEEIALAAARPLVEGAEATTGEAVVGVVDVAVDDEGDLVAGVEAATDGVGARADAEKVAASSSASASASVRRSGAGSAGGGAAASGGRVTVLLRREV